MFKNKTFALIGGDERQSALACYLARKSARVIAYNLNAESCKNIVKAESAEAAASLADYILLPLPAFEKDLRIKNSGGVTLAQLSCAGADTLFLGGMTASGENEAKRLSIKLIDYYQNEKLLQLNAVPTAEGAVAVAMRERKRTLSGSAALVTGYGRIAKLLSKLLLAFGADVTVAARSETSRLEAGEAGCSVIDIYNMNSAVERCDIIFNTVPSVVFDEQHIKKIKDGAVYIELASAPYGTDLEKAQQMGIKTVLAASLPGKVAPVSAGEAIGEAIGEIIKVKNNLK